MFTTHVLQNGVYRGQNTDLAGMLAQVRRKQAASTAPVEAVQKPPFVGVLTRTISESPAAKWVFAAQLRSEGRRDVVIVRERSIEIKELVNNQEYFELADGYELQDVAFKRDFQARILAAKPIPLDGSIVKLVRDPNARPSGWRAATSRPDAPTGLYATTESSNAVMEGAGMTPNGSDMATRRSSAGLPPDILALSLRSGLEDWLSFVFMTKNTEKGAEFVHFDRPLPSHNTHECRLGKHLAVDPFSRAIAVAAQTGLLTIFALKSREQMESENLEGGLKHFNPLVTGGEKTITVEGQIHRMEFLYPLPEDQNRVMLLLIMLVDGMYSLRRYDWDCSESIGNIRPVVERLKIPPERELPHLLIPITPSAGVMLICGSHVLVYRNNPAGIEPAQDLDISSAAEDETEDLTASEGAPLWTVCARSPRLSDWWHTDDHFFLAREDGVIRFVQLQKRNSQVKVTTCSSLGALDISIDQGVAILNSGGLEDGLGQDEYSGSADILYIAGSMGDGGLYRFQSRDNGRLESQLPSWDPVLDFAVIPATPSAAVVEPTISRSSQPRLTMLCERSRVFACAGSGNKHGSIREIRTGIPARILATAHLERLPGCSRIWAIPNPLAGGGTFLVRSSLGGTKLAFMEDEDLHRGADVVPYLIDASSSTLAAGLTASKLVVQVTTQELRAISALATGDLDDHVLCLRFNGSTITHASISTTDDCILLALRSHEQAALHCVRLSSEGASVNVHENAGGFFPSRYVLPAEPCSVLLQTTGDQAIGFVGTLDCRLLAYSVNGIELQPSCSFHFDGDNAVCENISVHACRPIGPRSQVFRVLCGLRNGVLYVLLLKHRSHEGLSMIKAIDKVN